MLPPAAALKAEPPASACCSPGPATTRHLKRTLTVVEIDGTPPSASSDDAPMSPAEVATPRRPGGGVLRLPLPSGAVRDSPMDPPLQPPPWKRPASFQAPQSPPRLLATPRVPQSPSRLLTPRVSWSDVVSHSQESLEEERQGGGSPPHTPRFRMRQPPSPPSRQPPLRRRPPSDDEDGLGSGDRDLNEGRFAREFCEVTSIGKGQFSTVYRARNHIDQCLYAVKKTTRISRGTRQSQLREVFALASCAIEAEACPNIVRYFSSWVEDGRLHIQTELCECSLRDRLLQRRRRSQAEAPGVVDPRFGEGELVLVLRHVAAGLSVLHGRGFVHLDIKPDNILVSRGVSPSGCYKIADLGLAAVAMGSGCDDISEGDCRYLAKEVLRGDLSQLPKADVFSLGLVCYELATNPRPLPCNGEEWHQLRSGSLATATLPPLAAPLLSLLRALVAPAPAERPPCEEITGHPSVAPQDGIHALQEEMQLRTLEAQRSRQLADEYWHEMMSMKKQELLGSGLQLSQPERPPLLRSKTT